MLPRRLYLALAAVVLLVGAALRLVGLDALLPSLIEPDAHIPVQVQLMDTAAPPAERGADWGAYPHLIAHLTRAFTDPPVIPSAAAELSEHLEAACWPVLRVRLVVAWVAILLIPATWLLARSVLGTGWALLAAAIVATSLLAIHFGTQARPHGAAVTFTTLAVAACVHLRRSGRPRAYLLAGLAVALALACLQSGVAVLLPLFVAQVGLVREHGARKLPWLAVPMGLAALAVYAAYPFLADGASESGLALGAGVVNQSGHKLFLPLFNGRGLLSLGRSLFAWEPALMLGAAGGLAAWLFRRRGGGAPRAVGLPVILAHALPYALVIGLYERSYERFLLPLVPHLAILASYGVSRLAGDAWTKPERAVATLALVTPVIALGLAFPSAVAVRMALARYAPSTIEQAAEWVEQNVEPSERLVVSRALGLPLSKTRAADWEDPASRPDRGLGWTSYQRDHLVAGRPQPARHMTWMPYTDLESLRSAARRARKWVAGFPARTCVAEVYADARNAPALTVVSEALRSVGQQRARFSPDGNAQRWDVPLVYQDETTRPIPFMAWRVLSAQRLGPVIEIHTLPGH